MCEVCAPALTVRVDHCGLLRRVHVGKGPSVLTVISLLPPSAWTFRSMVVVLRNRRRREKLTAESKW